MKKLSWLLISFSLVAMGLVGCSNRTNRVNDARVATNALGANCLNNQFTGYNYNGINGFNNGINCGYYNYNNGVFTNYPNTNGYYNGYNNGFVNGFSSCPYGSIAVYSPTLGLGCVPDTHLRGTGYNYAAWGWDSYSFSFGFQGSFSFGSGYYGNQVMQSCIVGTGTCGGFGGFGYCQPISGTIGVCRL